jgi:MerR family transcriptional regulator, light-induced transcriptional regulator
VPDSRGGSSTLTSTQAASQHREVKPAHVRIPMNLRPVGPALPPVDEEALRDFVRRLTHSGESAEHYLRDMLTRGFSAEHIYLQLFVPAARRLGAMWEDDRCSFVDVTLGVGRLQQLTHGFGDQLRGPVEPATTGRILVAGAPREQHTLGITIVAEFLRRDGWEVVLPPSTDDPRDLVAATEAEWFDVAAISASTDRSAALVRQVIREMRKRGRNHDLKVIVGGRAFLDAPELVHQVGADGSASDARGAANMALGMI